VKQRVFFIVGLPRSRTSWLAAWLTHYPRSFCFHDGLKDCAAPDDLAEKFRLTGADICGNADSGLPLFHERLAELFPEARYVFIERPMLDCWTSYKQFARLAPGQEPEAFRIFQRFDAAIEKMKISLLGNPRVKTFRFDDLNDAETARLLWQFCVPSVVFHLERWKEFNALRIEPANPFPHTRGDELLRKAVF
jgi:hypothetical protein